MKALVKENIRISLNSIKSHLLRTILTVSIIAFGIMALVGILTAIDSIEYFMNKNFMQMGSNTFTIKSRTMRIQVGNNVTKPKHFKRISYDDAINFKRKYNFPATTSVYTNATYTSTLKYKSTKTNPNIAIMGVDENYLLTAGENIAKGRNFSPNEVFFGTPVTIISKAISEKLFNKNEDPIDKIISIGPGKYRVIGVLESKGSSIGFTGDRNCYMPLSNVRQKFSRPNMRYKINVMADNPETMDAAIGEARGLFRNVRKLSLDDEDNFDISKSDKIVEILLDNTKYITLAATIIGLITLFGAAIGLMNSMLVSVTERTREIGIRKALGAKNKTIKNQFLVEAIVIAQLGGALGIILGILIGNILSLIIGSKFIIPWMWILLGVVLCFIVALVSGIIPATKASKLDPIESLRYE
ncbi:MAG: ABC transporter permease [Bacteroidales bacterium]|nr:ABC transporter permease [Bacteroidales bacterium]